MSTDANKNYEIRVTPSQIRASEDGKNIVGSIPYNTLSQDLGGFKERILPSAFAQTLNSDAEVWSYFQHDSDKVMARKSTGTLILNSTDTALEISIFPSDTSWSKDALEVIRHGDSDGFSFGFWIIEDSWSKQGTEIVRDLVSVELGEVSVVFNPAYKQNAKISVRALEQVKSFAPKEIKSEYEELKQKLAQLNQQL